MIQASKKPSADPTDDIRSNGIPALVMDFVLFKDEDGDTSTARGDVDRWLQDNVRAERYSVPPEGSRERMLSANGLATVTRGHITSGDDDSFIRVVLYPTNTNQLDAVKQLIRNNNGSESNVGTPFGVYGGGTRYNSGRPKVAVGVLMPIRMTAKDRGYAQAYRGIVRGDKAKRLPLPESD
jgi:hypothetical protein